MIGGWFNSGGSKLCCDSEAVSLRKGAELNRHKLNVARVAYPRVFDSARRGLATRATRHLLF